MKKTLFLAFLPMVCLLLTASVTRAQAKTDYAKMMTDSMKVSLMLTEEQYPKVYSINQDFTSKMGDIKQSSSNRMAKMKELKSVSESRDAALKGILTPDQFNTYEVNKKDRRAAAKSKYQKRNE